MCGWNLVSWVLFVISLLVGCAALQDRGQESPAPAVFRLKAPDARQVSVVGTFNGWDSNAHPLRGPDRDGVWSLSLPLPPGRYRYMFVVDGDRWMTDPDAVASEDDGFDGQNSVLFHGR